MIRIGLIRSLATLHRGAWLTRAVTLGVRAVVLRGDRVFLVRHTYTEGWYLPGGGVERGETAAGAAVRELREEGGLICRDAPFLHGLYRHGRRDHVACFVVRAVEDALEGRAAGGWEIAETRWFALDALPPDTTPATRARIAEIASGTAAPPDW